MRTYLCLHCDQITHHRWSAFRSTRACETFGCVGRTQRIPRKSVWRFMHFTTIPRPFGKPGPYMHRLQLIETPWFSVRLHVIRSADEDQDPHDHPFSFVSFVLFGWYDETLHGARYLNWEHRVRWFNVKRAPAQHRIVRKSKRPVVSLVFTNGRHRAWGYETKHGWLAWRDYKERQSVRMS